MLILAINTNKQLDDKNIFRLTNDFGFFPEKRALTVAPTVVGLVCVYLGGGAK